MLETARRVENHAQRTRPGHVPRRQLRIVGGDRPGADDDRIAECAQTVHVEEVFPPGYELLVAAMGRDEAIQALSQMTDGDWPRASGAAYREIQIDQGQPWIVVRQAGGPTRARAPSQ